MAFLPFSKPDRRSMQLYLLMCVAMVLSSCTSYQRARYNVEPPTAIRSKPTQKPYIVDGKRYEPLSSHEGFVQEGLASSYGQEFHGRKTSNGETFDMNALTAAHKTLPMGVYVRVQLKRNGNEVIVRINDRGPFVKDRIIDLSDAAAGRLGILREGVLPVMVTALGYRGEETSPTTAYRQPLSYDTGVFSLQVGAFTVKSNAFRYADELKRKYGSTDIQEAVVGGTKYYRVRLGRYTSLKNAQTAQGLYEHDGFNGCFVVAVD